MNDPLFSLQALLQQTIAGLDQAADEHRAGVAVEEVGAVAEVGSGIARVTGFTSLCDHELLRFPGGIIGIAANIDERAAGVILLGDDSALRSGDEVRRTGRVVDVPVGDALLGRVVDAGGRPVDERGPIDTIQRWPIERPAPPIMDRAPVSVPLLTGIKAIDAAIPIGRGQRELILGDRQTGKTAIALSAILNQGGGNTVCVYCAIGQRGSAIARAVDQLRRGGAMDYTVVVAAAGDDPPGLQYIAPYAATSIAEFFMASGRDVLVVYDDLTRHARAWRELSLLLRRPPGREAYPGDIFYVHSRLLERATHLRPEHGGGSLTALPIIETQAQNIAAYIPTNLISITDGQIYLSPQLFQRGQLPAIDIGLSVSRVGGKAQLPAYRNVAADLRLAYAQFEELEVFARFGTRLDQRTEQSLQRGWRVREILKQDEDELVSAPEQIVVLLAATRGLFDAVPLNRVGKAERALRRGIAGRLDDVAARISDAATLSDSDCEAIVEAAHALLAPFVTEVARGRGDGNA